MKTKAIYFGVLAMVITIGFALIFTDSGQIRTLSDTQLVKLRGGAILCTEGCEGSYCECTAHDCEDMECSPCVSGENDYYCKGNDGDGADVTDCWKTDTESDTCTTGDRNTTNCEVDRYSSTDSSCSGTPVAYDETFQGENCS